MKMNSSTENFSQMTMRNVIASDICYQENCNVDDARHCENGNEYADRTATNFFGGINVVEENHSNKIPMFQKGVLRTNCIDCLDRTNVTQYCYGLTALGQQLHTLGVKDSPKIDLDDPLADKLMGFYERMGDTLAHQYGGSAAHNKEQVHGRRTEENAKEIFRDNCQVCRR